MRALARAAAKFHADVAVVVSPDVYSGIVEELEKEAKRILLACRRALAKFGLGCHKEYCGRQAVALGARLGEIEEQNRMLDDFDEDLDSTMGRMEGVLTKMDKMLKSKNRCQTYSILFLIFVLMILVILVWTT